MESEKELTDIARHRPDQKKPICRGGGGDFGKFIWIWPREQMIGAAATHSVVFCRPFFAAALYTSCVATDLELFGPSSYSGDGKYRAIQKCQ